MTTPQPEPKNHTLGSTDAGGMVLYIIEQPGDRTRRPRRKPSPRPNENKTPQLPQPPSQSQP